MLIEHYLIFICNKHDIELHWTTKTPFFYYCYIKALIDLTQVAPLMVLPTDDLLKMAGII